MTERTQAILHTMWDSKKPIPADLIQELTQASQLAHKAGGTLYSRQVVASIIARYLPKD